MSLQARTRDEVGEALARVLTRRELDEGPSALEEIASWIAEHLLPDVSPEGQAVVAAVLRTAGWIAAALLLVALVVLLVRRRRGSPASDPRAATRSRVLELRALAADARARGEPALALRYLFFALVVGLGQRGDLRYRDAWTAREMLERGHPRPEARELLGALLTDLEAKEFGRVPVTAADLDRLDALCDRFVGARA